MVESMAAEWDSTAVRRAAIHAALADPARLAIVDRLLLADASPSEWQALPSMPSKSDPAPPGGAEQPGSASRPLGGGSSAHLPSADPRGAGSDGALGGAAGHAGRVCVQPQLRAQPTGRCGVESTQFAAGGLGGHSSGRRGPSRRGRGRATSTTRRCVPASRCTSTMSFIRVTWWSRCAITPTKNCPPTCTASIGRFATRCAQRSPRRSIRL